MTSERVLCALYCVNKYAKEYAKEATKSYESNQKTLARVLSVKKTALYGLKEYILEELFKKECVNKIDLHTISGEQYYCLYIDDYSFHIPYENASFVDNIDEQSDITDEFDGSSESSLPMDEKQALELLEERFVSANEFIEQRFARTGYSARPIGWSYLSGYVEQGDIVPESRVIESDTEDYSFDVGDCFETVEKGNIQILDRNGMWTDGNSHRDDFVRVRPVYTVKFSDGEVRTGVQQERITWDWRIELKDTESIDGVTRISGSAWDEYLIPRIESVPFLSEGDILVFDETTDAQTARIDGIETNDLVMLFFRLDWEEQDWTDHFTPNEFLEDVKYVERDGEKIQICWSYGNN